MTLKLLSSYAPVDEEFDKVSLLLHGDGTNGSTTIVDSSSNVNSVTANNGAQISTTQSKFGGSSIEFLSTANTGLSVTPSSVFQFGTGDWTVEAWIYQRGQVQYSTLYEIGNHANVNSMLISVGSGGFGVYAGGWFGPQTNTFTLNTWQHTAVTRAGNLLYFFLNGTIVGNSGGYSFTRDLTSTPTVSVAYPYGALPTATVATYRFNGYIDDFRITKGVARYTANFTPPTAPFPDLGPRIPQHIVLQHPDNNDPLLDLNTQPSLDLQFATGKTLNDRVSGFPLVNHQRDASSGKSAGTYVGSDGLIKTSVVNLLTYSELIDTTGSWTENLITATPNQPGPFGVSTASLVVNTNNGNLSKNVSSAIGTYTLSFYARSGASPWLMVGLTVDGVFTRVWWNLTTQTIGSSDTLTHSIVPVDATWSRCTVVIPVVTGPFTSINWYITDNDNTNARTNTSNSFYMWGAQLQEGALTDYIPTTNLPSGAPRFDHDPVTGESLGLLIEESRTNLAKYSEPDDRSTNGVSGEWYLFDLDPNTEITKVEGPDGVSNSASEMQLATGSVYDTILLQVPVTPGASYTFSAWVKLGTATNLALHVNNGMAWNTVPDGTYSFDVNDGLSTNTFVKVSHTFTAPSSGMVNVSTGRHLGTAPVQQTQGTVTVWGCQLELGAFSSSTIITTGSTVTRAADVASIEGTNFSSWYNDTATTLYIESPDFPNYGNLPNNAFVYISDQNIGSTAAGDGIKFGTGSPGTKNRVFVTEGGVTTADSNNQQASKFAIALSENDFSYAIDGTSAATDNTVIMPTGMDRLAMTGLGPGVAHITRLTYYPYRLTDATLQEITS